MTGYIGRFAPTPSGPLHMGSLLAALISYLDARASNGRWLVRIEDIDPPREQQGASELILQSLLGHGFEWDSEPTYQSTRSALYEQNLSKLKLQGACYDCPCSRQDLKLSGGKHKKGCGYYSSNGSSTDAPFATRFRTTQAQENWQDCLLGPQTNLLEEDFVLKRKDKLYAYQLAVVSDDIQQGITHIIRGNDLTSSTPMQLALYRTLNEKSPEFGHFPVIRGYDGKKLSKQNLAPAINSSAALTNLKTLMGLIGIVVPISIHQPKQALDYGVGQWQRKLINPAINGYQL
jgi:glutamyl-Q tRNA(Asp) synthetase